MLCIVETLSVTDLTEQISMSLQKTFTFPVVVEGEISNFSQATSGHWYFTLKDKSAQIKAVMFKGSNMKMELPHNGVMVLAIAEVSFYKGRGECQLICKSMHMQGTGALLAKLEALKQQLSKEGLFAPERKKPIPSFIQTIGIISSINAAALQDMLKIFREKKAPLMIYIFPCKVQGVDSGRDITKAINNAVHFSKHTRHLDCLVLSRGGGSTEDLISFSDECVVRSIDASPIPIITGIGHEIDISLADLASDHHEPTPTAAAMYICNPFILIDDRLHFLIESLQTIYKNKTRDLYDTIEVLSPQTLSAGLVRKMQNTKMTIDSTTEMIKNKVLYTFTELQQNLLRYTTTIEALSPQNILKKGFVLIKDKTANTIITSAAQTKTDDDIIIMFHDDSKYATIK